jgi:hypothetical protein
MVTDLPDYEKKVVVVTIPGEYPSLVEVDVVKVDGVAIATPTVVGCLPVSIEHTVGINHLQIKGVTLKDPTVAACLPISIEHTVDINHKQILGVALKTPTNAQCVPISVENAALAYDSTNNRFYVDLAKISATDILAVSATDLDIRALTSVDVVTVKSITDALPAGSNAIGKLAANSGVDIGDVDVKTMPDVTQSDASKLKATVSATLLDIRALTLADVVTVKSITDALPTGSNAIGKLAANDGVNIGHVDVVTMPDVTQAMAANLKATVTQAEKDRTISDITKTTTIVSIQATAANNTIIQTPAAGKKIRVKLVDVWNNGAAAITVYLRFAAAGTARFKKTLNSYTGFIINLIGTNWEGAADEVLYINLSAIGTVDVTVMKDEV